VIEECAAVAVCSVTSVDGSALLGDDITGDKKSSQPRSLELKVKSLQQENEALIRVSKTQFCFQPLVIYHELQRSLVLIQSI